MIFQSFAAAAFWKNHQIWQKNWSKNEEKQCSSCLKPTYFSTAIPGFRYIPDPNLSLLALCVIFTILVSFSRDNALFASKAKINVFWNFFKQSGPEGVKKKFQKTLILAFEVIVQPPKTHFSTFSKVQKQKKVRPKSWKSHIVYLGVVEWPGGKEAR